MSHTTCNHVNTTAANNMCDSFRAPKVIVAFGGSYIRENIHKVRANAALKARMDRNS
jgi:hypothetical protein